MGARRRREGRTEINLRQAPRISWSTNQTRSASDFVSMSSDPRRLLVPDTVAIPLLSECVDMIPVPAKQVKQVTDRTITF
jgi:hypothetical protein